MVTQQINQLTLLMMMQAFILLILGITILQIDVVQSFKTSVQVSTATIGRQHQHQQYHHHASKHQQQHIVVSTVKTRGGVIAVPALHHQKSNTSTSTSTSTSTRLHVATTPSPSSSSPSPSSKPLLAVEWNQDRVVRSFMASLGCIMTWSMVRYLPFGLTTVQASCITGIISCLLFTINTSVFKFMYHPSYTVATFCGALAGMSGNVLQTITSSTTTAVPSPLLPMAYFSACVGYAFGLWDYRKWGVGMGGRLGTIAGAANLFYTVTTYILQRFMSTTGSKSTITLIPSTTIQLYSSLPILTSMALSLITIQSSREKIKSSSVGTTSTSSSSSSSLDDMKTQKNISKLLLYCTIVIPMIMNGKVAIVDYIGTILSIMLGNQLVYHTIQKFNQPILSTSIVGLFGSLAFAGSGYYSISSFKIFLGALMGLTSLSNFTTLNFLQSSLFSSSLFHLGILDGFGGKLGCLAYFGVLFGM